MLRQIIFWGLFSVSFVVTDVCLGVAVGGIKMQWGRTVRGTSTSIDGKSISLPQKEVISSEQLPSLPHESTVKTSSCESKVITAVMSNVHAQKNGRFHHMTYNLTVVPVTDWGVHVNGAYGSQS